MTTAAVDDSTSLTACGALAASLGTLALAWRARARRSITAFAHARTASSLAVVATLA